MVNASVKKVPTRIKGTRTASDVLVIGVAYSVLVIAAVVTLYPFVNLVAVAFSPYEEFLKNPLMLWPKNITTKAFSYVFASKMLWRSYGNTLFITSVGTALSLLLTVVFAYPLSKPYLKGRGVVSSLMIFTMLFSGGLIPGFLLIRGLGLYNSIWAMILPSLMAPFNVVLAMNFFKTIPESLEEAAYIDGAGEWTTFVRIVLPLSVPVLSTIGLFEAVKFWNTYFSGVIYLRDRMKWPLQLLLREILLAANNMALSTGGNLAEMDPNAVPVTNVRYASVIVVMLPIICVYPFLQKYFAKGMLVGAVKG